MTKQELLQEMKASREFNTFGRTRLWKAAFEKYREARGEKLSLQCGKCFAKVKEWLLE